MSGQGSEVRGQGSALAVAALLAAAPAFAAGNYELRAPLKSSAKQLAFSSDETGIHIAHLCDSATQVECPVAPDATYVSAHGLMMTISDGLIQVKGLETSYCNYEMPKLAPAYFADASPDGKEFITCEDRD